MRLLVRRGWHQEGGIKRSHDVIIGRQ
jgi:hypothetical protein